jgi:Serine/threonine protein kinase
MLAPETLIHNRYRIVRAIGKGGMGAVYEAFDLRLQSPVALKQMIVEGEHLSRAFAREAQLLASLRHQALPRVIDYFVDDQGEFLVMEFIPGRRSRNAVAKARRAVSDRSGVVLGRHIAGRAQLSPSAATAGHPP